MLVLMSIDLITRTEIPIYISKSAVHGYIRPFVGRFTLEVK